MQHPLSIPNDTAWGSDDAIVTVDHDGDKGTGVRKSSMDGLRVFPDVNGVSYANERHFQAGLRGDSLSLGDILMVREWRTVEGHADPDLESREVHVESAGSVGAQGSVVKLEDAKRRQNMG